MSRDYNLVFTKTGNNPNYTQYLLGKVTSKF